MSDAPTPSRPVNLSEPIEPISISEARAHLSLVPDVDSDGIESHPQDAMIAALLSAAREWAEDWTGLLIAHRQVSIAVDAFPTGRDPMPLGVSGVHELVDIQYVLNGERVSTAIQSSSDDVVLLGAELDTYANPSRLILAPGNDVEWPIADTEPNAVLVTVDAGFSAVGAIAAESSSSYDLPPEIPRTVRSAILLILGHLYENRENTISGTIIATVPLGAEILLRFHRHRLGFA